MISNNDLALLVINRLIIHDIPKHVKNDESKPTLANSETTLDDSRKAMLRDRLVRVIGAASTYSVKLSDTGDSPVPPAISELTSPSVEEEELIFRSQEMATYLHTQQNGAMSPGLLCVIAVSSGSSRGVAIMKLEREEGARLQLKEEGNKKAFEMSVLDDLVLTDGTRLFKSALFLRDAIGIRAAACDSQTSSTPGADIASFWLRFLGCQQAQDPRIATRNWFEATIDFINKEIDDPVKKNSIYEHTMSELNSNRSTVSPRKFMEDYLPKGARNKYSDYLLKQGIPLAAFRKNTEEIESKIRRRTLYTSKGFTVSAPEDQQQFIDVQESRIVVNDRLKTVAHQ